MASRLALVALVALPLPALAACGADREPSAASAPATTDPTRAPLPTPPPVPQPKPRHVRPARCPQDAGDNCAEATGEIVYLESKDPDGDGDLHLVVLGGDITGPGLSVFDIEKELRPPRDPHVGDMASAAGPVYKGSYGQRQIQATVLHLAPRR